ncbi:RNA-binding protein rnp24 [Taphrina deformans PYCC 5710]|uniref:RNA-binding protein rnp24 n=1 Tax=Taphrina deformans (strain PYCC 5710 / ATCC 11124 / CBS 356.35 / IMI 108563 / JCM 9778 / NBRC 8474) TaxID=1097556 RepID=R4X8P2_TAPDE|nr:RNA-binding protein rnp24 [Taphrina deformans PYCC 5710]|eukprot:CCG82003.1 RNA-binding protein rnp24 [Taphrina deformans PYCC 5710]
MSESKKRSRETADAAEELEIDVNLDEPLSKRAARRLKKGRTLKQAPSSQKPLPREFQDHEDESDDNDDDDQEKEIEKAQLSSEKSDARDKKKKKEKEKGDKKDKKSAASATHAAGPDATEYKKGTNGIWIGNLNFKTTETDLTTFFSTLRPLGKARPASSYPSITAPDVVRISLPAGARGGECRGFAYIDFARPDQVETAVLLSERILLGRNVLIKPAANFDGRPSVSPAAAVGAAARDAGKAETKILYVGNLSFDVTDDDLATYLGGPAAGIKKVRMATFEDSGKCKGFAFVDFDEVEHVRKVLANRRLLTMNGRKLKMEFGEDRSLRRKPPTNRPVDGFNGGTGGGRMAGGKVDARSIKPGKALMDAPRASHAIVASSGEKVSFE